MAVREVRVHLTPQLVAQEQLPGSVAVVIDVLRASTTIIYALAAGCARVHPCGEIGEAKALAASLPRGTTLLGGERDGKPIAGFDLGNSPREYTAKLCNNRTLILTTSNGTRALLRAATAARIFVAGFVNFSAVCEQLQQDARPIHIVCAADEGEPCLEDTLLAGAFIEVLCDTMDVHLNDSARLAWDCFENHRQILLGALDISKGGEHLKAIGYAADIPLAAEIDRFTIVPELRHEPLRIEVASASIVKRRWLK